MFLLVILVGVFGCVDTSKETTLFFQDYIKGVEYNNNALDYRNVGNIYYDTFYMYYVDDYFEEAIENCKDAREYYVYANREHNLANVYFRRSKDYMVEGYEDLIEAYINYGEITIKLNWLNYEACEYFEEGSYNFMMGDLDSGNLEIEKGNEKTTERDNLVEEMNEYVSIIEVLAVEKIK